MDLREHQQRAIRARWSKPENVQKRIDALKAHVRKVVDTLPPLTPEQKAELAALLAPAEEIMIVHIAGNHVTVNQHLRQRCAWCGATLIDQDLTLVAVPVDQPPSSYPTWPIGELVAVHGNAKWIEEHKDGDQLPAEACARVDPAVTR